MTDQEKRYNSMTAISVIVPIYNNEKSAEECIGSILSQSFENFELILVDDGSTDGSSDICDRYGRKDSRVKVIHNTNHGVSHARNTGIEMASGEYIAFVDADDYINKDTLKIAYDNIRKNEVDVVIWNNFFCKGESEKENIEFPKTSIINNRTVRNELVVTTLCPTMTSFGENAKVFVGMGFVWNKLFKKELIDKNEIRFDSGVELYEDVAFICKYMNNVESVSFVDTPLYHYRVSDKGATLRYKPNIIESNKLLMKSLDAILDVSKPMINEAYNCRLIRMLGNILQFYYFHTDHNEGHRITDLRQTIRSDEHYINALRKVKMRNLTVKLKITVIVLRALMLV